MLTVQILTEPSSVALYRDILDRSCVARIRNIIFKNMSPEEEGEVSDFLLRLTKACTLYRCVYSNSIMHLVLLFVDYFLQHIYFP